MQDSDKERFFSILVGSAEIAGKPLSKHGMALYWKMLKKYDIEAIDKAFIQHGLNPDNGQFMPKPGDIVKYIDGTGEDRGMLAWSTVDKTIRRLGSWVDEIAFDDSIIHAVISDMGGWTGLCATKSEEDLKFKGIEFGKRYRAYALKSEFEYPKMIKGASTTKYPTILIGNKEKAQAVIEGGNEVSLQISHVSDLVKLTKDEQ